MRLKKIELYGFKSFASRTEIVFGEGITGIVGPNGSGKSNIGDAVRWVLGEQSAKTLRGASMQDVIFNGTQKRKPMSYCEVSLVFDNEDGGLRSTFAEVMVTRRVYRSGDSEYFLNRASCRLKDIVELFRDTGIGREGYSIIGQGRIDEILSRKSEDRRQVFEEAAGIVAYRSRKEEADRKLEKTLENAARIDDILEELGRQLGPLEKQSRSAREYIELSGELKGLDLNLFLRKSDQWKTRLDTLDAELNGLRDVLTNAETTLGLLTAGRDGCQETIAQLDEKIAAARTRLDEAANALQESRVALSAAQTRKSAREENRTRVQESLQQGADKLAELESLQTSGDTERAAQEKLVADAEKLLEETQRNADEAKNKEQEADDALEKHKEEVLEALNRVSSARNDQTRIRTMRDQMNQRLEEIQKSEESQQEEEQRLIQTEKDAQALLDREKSRRRELAENAQSEQENVRESENTVSAVRTQAEELSSQLQEKQSRYRLLSELTREMEGFNQSVRRAVQYGKERSIPGVKGVLIQLISVPAKYETAMDVALGAAQQNIVTDTEETAKMLIDYLRQNRLGRATFLPVSAVRGRTLNPGERQVLNMTGCIGVASELVSCAPEYRGIIDSLLGRTVVADNLDHGIAIMRAGNHAFRLVTLEGDVMNTGGSMTGGSAQSKMVNLLSREREVKELAEALQAGKVRFDQMKAKLQEVTDIRAAAREALSSAIEAVHQQDIAVARETERTTNAHNELESHRARMAESRQAVDQLNESIAELTRELEEMEQASGSADADQEELNRRTGVLQQALSDARKTSAEAADRVVVRTLQLSDLKHTLDVMHHDSDRCVQDREQLLRDREDLENQLKEMAEQDQADSDEILRLTVEIENRDQLKNDESTVAEDLEKNRRATQEKLSGILTDMENLHEAITRDSEKLHRAELVRSRVDTELRQLQDRIWASYELTYAGAEEFRIRDEDGFNAQQAEKRAAELSAKIRALGTVNVNAVEEYTETKTRYDDLKAQQEDMRKAEQELRLLIDELLDKMKVQFVSSFNQIQEYFTETFTRLFGGGHAELKLADPEDPLNCGIDVIAQPPGKRLQLLSLLSGGERALTAIAILFAMLKLKPTPFCILDEIEAALDDANIGYYADYLLEYSKGTQFIVITHRKGTMERCNALYGVSMEEQGVSKLVSVSLQDYEE